MATKAIHLELVTDLTTDAFIAAFKRFMARRGKVKNIYSDNAKTLVGADKELKLLYNFLKCEQAQSTLMNAAHIEDILWHFIPLQVPHFGGVWKAGIKSVKYHLKRIGLSYKNIYNLGTN